MRPQFHLMRLSFFLSFFFFFTRNTHTCEGGASFYPQISEEISNHYDFFFLFIIYLIVYICDNVIFF